MSEQTRDLSPLEWRIVWVLRQRPAGSTIKEIHRLVPQVGPKAIRIFLQRILDKGYATEGRVVRGRGRPRLLYTPAGCVRSELRKRIEEFLSTDIRTPEALTLLLEALEAHQRSSSID